SKPYIAGEVEQHQFCCIASSSICIKQQCSVIKPEEGIMLRSCGEIIREEIHPMLHCAEIAEFRSKNGKFILSAHEICNGITICFILGTHTEFIRPCASFQKVPVLATNKKIITILAQQEI